MSSFLDDLKADAIDSLTGGGVRVYVKSNLGPAVPVYTGSSSEPGLLSKLGIKAGIIVTDDRGRTLYRAGEPAPTDPLKAGALVLGVGIIAWFLGRGLWRRL